MVFIQKNIFFVPKLIGVNAFLLTWLIRVKEIHSRSRRYARCVYRYEGGVGGICEGVGIEVGEFRGLDT